MGTSMVEKYVMSRSVGLVSHGKGGRNGGGGSGMSDSTKSKIDEEVRKLTEDSYKRALNMLKKNKQVGILKSRRVFIVNQSTMILIWSPTVGLLLNLLCELAIPMTAENSILHGTITFHVTYYTYIARSMYILHVSCYSPWQRWRMH